MEHHSQKRPKSASDASSNVVLPPIPVFRTQDVSLNADVTAKIFELLDPASYCTATALSKSHKAALIPRQTHVWYAGFKTLEAFKRMNFVSMTFFSLRTWWSVTNDVFQTIADGDAYPNLQGVDFTNGHSIRAENMAEFIERLGPRLKTFIFHEYVAPCVMNALRDRAPNLTSLTIWHMWYDYAADLSDLKHLKSLRELSVETFKDGISVIVTNLPESLQVLRIKCGYQWELLKNASPLPNLLKLEITDREEEVKFSCLSGKTQMVPVDSDLSAELLIDVMSKAPLLKSFQLSALSTRAPLVNSHLYWRNSQSTEQEERLFGYMQERGIKFIGPEHVTEACGASAAMFQQWRNNRRKK